MFPHTKPCCTFVIERILNTIMKKLILVGASVLMMSVMAVAQPGKPSKKTPQERAGNQTERLAKELSLTPEQAAKVKEILSSKVTEMDSLRAKKMAGAEKKDVRTDRKAAMEKTDAELKAVLTPEQYAKLKAIQEEKKEKMQEHNKNKPNGKKKMK
jgi:protein CpxP